MTTDAREQSAEHDAGWPATPPTGAEVDASADSGIAGSSMGRRALLPARLPLLALVFIAGVVSLAIEMCGPRLMAPYFGTSQIIWATQIGFTLIYLSLGYYIGGRVADRYPRPEVICGITAVAAAATGLIPIISRPVLDWSVGGLTNANSSVFVGALIAVNLLFAVPTILLGMVSPYAIRLTVERIGSAGRSAGSLYALSTVGSIIGAFLPVLVLIPAWGVRNTLYAACLVLLITSFWGLRLRGRMAGVLLVAVLAVPMLAQGPLKSRPGLIYEQESLYNYIQVVRGPDGTNNLILNEGAGAIHSKYNPDRVLFGPSWYAEYLLMAPYFNAGFTPDQLHRIAIIGLAGGTIARQFTAAYGQIPIDGVEIDPAIVDVGRKYFGMNEPDLHVYVGDGRTFMRTTAQTYDVVAVDAFQQPYMPFQLTTREFFEEIKAHLSPTGVVTVTTGHTCTDYRLVQAFVNTLAQVFPSVYTFDVADTFNTEVVATMRPTTLATFQQNLQAIPPGTMLGTVAAETLPVMKASAPERGGIVFTDDRAPVEQLTDQLILNYIRCK
ncbi:MAG TPA: fused MFS/spermidine synthase [Ktedonobacterales bacterium]|nr:fused MFS/spermidine synthase [Ktedonobacterales bacterium]